MNMMTKLIRLLTPVAILLGLIGCGGGGAGGTTVAGGGIGGTGAPVGISFGEVTQFGSATVTGIEFNTSNAKIIKDDVELRASALQLGMTVEVHGSIDSATTGTADIVFIDEAVIIARRVAVK